MKNMELLNKIMEEKRHARSAWKNGVCDYAIELLDSLETKEITREALLNGAENWANYSYGGCSLIYDGDICERLCNDTEKKKTRNGELMPNSRENWLDVQTRALSQACSMILRIAKIAQN